LFWIPGADTGCNCNGHKKSIRHKRQHAFRKEKKNKKTCFLFSTPTAAAAVTRKAVDTNAHTLSKVENKRSVLVNAI